MRGSVVIVSNRLPVSVKRGDSGGLEFYPSVGGLATGLAGYVEDKRNKWIGWPGIAADKLSEKEKSQITDELLKHNCYPVFLKQKQLDDFYNGYSNSILWPLFHDMPTKYDEHERFWKAYQSVNRQFADSVLALSDADSTVWVHDYQLLTLPLLLRKARPEGRIGFFLHIPFPAASKLAQLPSAKPLLEGMLGADLLGLHTRNYVQDFLEATAQLTRHLVEEDTVILPDRAVKVTDFPISIDYDKFAAAREQDAVQREAAEIRKKYKDQKIILTVDRLDPSKGLTERLQAYYDFLKQNKQFHGKVVMIMLAVPSRTEIEEYRLLKEKVEELVGLIRAEFETRYWKPIDYRYTSLPFESVAALYQAADVAFITPIRDGMNLVAKEYIASKKGESGVLILSETAGAAQELTDALMVNPSKPATLVKALSDAITMPGEELRKRIGKMQEQVAGNTIHTWTKNFMGSLQRPVPATPHFTRSLTRDREQDLADAFHRSRKPLLIFDYDGVLTPIIDKPGNAKLPAATKKLLTKIASAGRADVAVLSGRSRQDLEEWLGDLPVTLVGEHGAMHRPAGKQRWRHELKPHAEWQDEVMPIFERYASMTPGAHVERKDYSVVWHYRTGSAYYSQKHLVALRRLLKPIARKHNLEVQSGSKILEVRPVGVNKGASAMKLLKPEHDFVLAIGDDKTDEDMFEALPLSAYTIKVGRGRTAARYRAGSPEEVSKLLKHLSKT